MSLTLSFIALLVLSALVMKSASWMNAPVRPSISFPRFLFSPLFSVDSWHRAQPVTAGALVRVIRDLIAHGLALAAIYLLFHSLHSHLPRWSWPYVVAPAVLCAGEVCGAILQLLFASTGLVFQAHHQRPLLAASVAEFWGKRWNTWLGDWFRQILFTPLKRYPLAAMALTFFFSGLWHELLINVPFFLLIGRSLFGTMLLYFVLQFPAVLVERNFPRHWTVLRRAWVYVVVIGMAPLFCNESTLRILKFWPNS